MNQRMSARTWVARATQWPTGSSSGQPMSARSKYSMLISPPVVDAVELGEHGGEVDVAADVGVSLRVTLRGLAQLHVIGVAQHLHRVLAPGGHVAGVDGEAQPGHSRHERLDLLDAPGARARTRFEPHGGVLAHQRDGLVEAVLASTLERCDERAAVDEVEAADAVGDRDRERVDGVVVESVEQVDRGVEVVEPERGGSRRHLVEGHVVERHADDADRTRLSSGGDVLRAAAHVEGLARHVARRRRRQEQHRPRDLVGHRRPAPTPRRDHPSRRGRSRARPSPGGSPPT